VNARRRLIAYEKAGPLGRPGIALIAFVGAILLFLAAPNFIVIPISFTSANYLSFPPPGWSLQWYENYLGSSAWMEATGRSVFIGLLTAAVATALGTAAALGLRRMRRGKEAVQLIVLAPLIVPTIIIAIAIYDLYSRLGLVGNVYGIALIHVVIAFPYVAIVVSAALRGVDPGLERAAQNLGAGPWRTFWLVTFPLIRPGVIAGALLAFLASFDEVVIAIFIGGVYANTLPRMMWESIITTVDPTIAAVSTLLVFLSTGVLAALAILRRKDIGER
jgi:putative spermidine/putrescine transport system permease protein